MPALTPAQYGAAQATLHGHGRTEMPMKVAEEMIAKTTPEKRSQFARANARKRVLRRKKHQPVVLRRKL